MENVDIVKTEIDLDQIAQIEEVDAHVDHAWEIGIGCSTPF